MSNHTVTNSENIFASVLLQYTVAALPYVILDSVTQAAATVRLKHQVSPDILGAGVTVDDLWALAYLEEFTGAIAALESPVISGALIPVVRFFASSNLATWKGKLGEKINVLLGLGGNMDCHSINCKIAGAHDDASQAVISAVGASMMGLAKLYGDADDSYSFGLAALDSAGFMLLSFASFASANKINECIRVDTGHLVVNTAIYAGAGLMNAAFQSFTKVNATVHDIPEQGMLGNFLSFCMLKGPAIISDTISPLIPGLVLTATVHPLLYPSINAVFIMGTALIGSVAKNVDEFWKIPELGTSTSTSVMLVIGAATAAALSKPLHSKSSVFGVSAKYSYAFFGALSFLKASADLTASFAWLWFNNETVVENDSGDEDIVNSADEIAVPDDAHAGVL